MYEGSGEDERPVDEPQEATMAHHSGHHHHNNNAAIAGPRPLALRVLAVAALVLPVALFIVSLGLALATMYNPAYAVADLYNSSSMAAGVQLYGSPFFHCPATSDGADAVDDPAAFQQNCSRVSYLGGKGMDACYAAQGAGFPNTQFCQKSVSAASLYVAGAVLVGVAILAGAGAAALGWRYAWGTSSPATTGAAEKDGHAAGGAAVSAVVWAAPLLGWVAGLLGLLAALCLVAGQALGISTYVSDKRPTAGNDVDAFQGRWYMGTPALAFSSVAWLSAALGAFVSSTGFGVKGL